MRQFFAITHYEFCMSIRRIGYWIAYALLSVFYAVTVLPPSEDWSSNVLFSPMVWQQAGHLVFLFNVFMPLLAGLLTADRLQRDFRGGLNELQRSTPLPRTAYILSKYLGALAGSLLPFFAVTVITGAVMVAAGRAPVEFFWPLLVAFLAIAVPSHIFVVAFSLICPLVIPLRIYQVLFTGYWFWGNLLSPKAFPTISDTVLNAVGQYPLQAYFSVLVDSTQPVATAFTKPEAVINLLVLLACSAAILLVGRFYLHKQSQKA